MATNIWQRSVSKTLLRIVQEVGAMSPQAFREINLTPIIDAAEDAEREGHQCDNRCNGDNGHHTWPAPAAGSLPMSGEIRTLELRGDEPYIPPGAPGGVYVRSSSLPPLDPALVEECARVVRENFHGIPGLKWPADRPRESRTEWERWLLPALTHYRERVERPLREELAGWIKGANAEAHEADRLRAELNQYDERGHDARNEIEELRAELATLKSTNKLLAEERDAHSNARQAWQAKAEGDFAPATDEERKRLADMLRHCAKSGGASNPVPVRADDLRRIATLLESPAPRKSLGRRWVVQKPNGEVLTFTFDDVARRNAEHYGGTVTECDLVPVGEGGES